MKRSMKETVTKIGDRIREWLDSLLPVVLPPVPVPVPVKDDRRSRNS
ncbi:hypothetical protein [Geomonas ferrireducens]|nr:hypothetical protein [Geomonas ferrireducens]